MSDPAPSNSQRDRRVALIGAAAGLVGVIVGSVISGYITTLTVRQQIQSSREQTVLQTLFDQRNAVYVNINEAASDMVTCQYEMADIGDRAGRVDSDFLVQIFKRDRGH
jgi:hypothetical protein